MAVSGTWNLKFSWGCAGSYGSSPITFNANGTFSLPPYTGRWSQTNGNIVWLFDQVATVYGGVVNGGAIVGNMSNFSIHGCFYALTQSGAPQAEQLEAAAVAGQPDAAGDTKKK